MSDEAASQPHYTACQSPTLSTLLEKLELAEAVKACVAETDGHSDKVRTAKSLLKKKLSKQRIFIYKRNPPPTNSAEFGAESYVQYEIWTGFPPKPTDGSEDMFTSALKGRGSWDPQGRHASLQMQSLTAPDPHKMPKYSFNLQVSGFGKGPALKDNFQTLIGWYTLSLLKVIPQQFVARVHDFALPQVTDVGWHKLDDQATANSLALSLHPEDVAAKKKAADQTHEEAQEAEVDAQAAAETAQANPTPANQVKAQNMRKKAGDKKKKARQQDEVVQEDSKLREQMSKASREHKARKALGILTKPSMQDLRHHVDQNFPYCQTAGAQCGELMRKIQGLLAEIDNILARQDDQVQEAVVKAEQPQQRPATVVKQVQPAPNSSSTDSDDESDGAVTETDDSSSDDSSSSSGDDSSSSDDADAAAPAKPAAKRVLQHMIDTFPRTNLYLESVHEPRTTYSYLRNGFVFCKVGTRGEHQKTAQEVVAVLDLPDKVTDESAKIIAASALGYMKMPADTVMAADAKAALDKKTVKQLKGILKQYDAGSVQRKGDVVNRILARNAWAHKLHAALTTEKNRQTYRSRQSNWDASDLCGKLGICNQEEGGGTLFAMCLDSASKDDAWSTIDLVCGSGRADQGFTTVNDRAKFLEDGNLERLFGLCERPGGIVIGQSKKGFQEEVHKYMDKPGAQAWTIGAWPTAAAVMITSAGPRAAPPTSASA